MSVPQSVRDQAQRAQDAQEALMNPSIEKPETHQDTPEKKPVLDQSESNLEDKPVQSAPLPTEDAAYWEHRFKVVQGKLNREVPALNARIKELEEEIQELRQSSLNSESSPMARAQSVIEGLSQEEIDDYGSDLIDLITRISRNVSTESGAATASDVASLRSQVEQINTSSKEDAEARFWATLQSKVPNWREINGSADFHRYLALIEPMSGRSRQELLETAQTECNAPSVIEIFNSFIRNQPEHAGFPSEKQSPTSRGAETEFHATDLKTWTQGEIRDFYSKAARGAYTPEQKQRIEAEIFEASANGRVI